MAASGVMPIWTNNASVPPRVIAHPRRGAGISYNYKYKYNTNADKNTNVSPKKVWISCFLLNMIIQISWDIVDLTFFRVFYFFIFSTFPPFSEFPLGNEVFYFLLCVPSNFDSSLLKEIYVSLNYEWGLKEARAL